MEMWAGNTFHFKLKHMCCEVRTQVFSIKNTGLLARKHLCLCIKTQVKLISEISIHHEAHH